MIYLYALTVVIIGLFQIFIVMSIIDMFITGFKKYRLSLKYLWSFRIDGLFHIDSSLITNYNTISERNYYIVTIINSKEVIICRLSSRTCIFKEFLKLRYIRKIKNSLGDSTPIIGNDLDKFINSELKRLSRDKKLDILLK